MPTPLQGNTYLPPTTILAQSMILPDGLAWATPVQIDKGMRTLFCGAAEGPFRKEAAARDMRQSGR